MKEQLLLLGSDHATWGEYSLATTAGGRSAGALSVGVDPTSPSMASKGDRTYPNEDAVLVIEEAGRTLLAVADAHHGHQASHELLSALSTELIRVPDRPDQLHALLEVLPVTEGQDASSSTLLIGVLDRESGGFGLSVGDSTLVMVSAKEARILNLRRADYVNLRGPEALQPGWALAFEFDVRPGELLVAHTDGVDQCHYRHPESSVTPADLLKVFGKTGAQPREYTAALMELALAGVGGHPGGQDNIAIAATLTGTGEH